MTTTRFSINVSSSAIAFGQMLEAQRTLYSLPSNASRALLIMANSIDRAVSIKLQEIDFSSLERSMASLVQLKDQQRRMALLVNKRLEEITSGISSSLHRSLARHNNEMLKVYQQMSSVQSSWTATSIAPYTDAFASLVEDGVIKDIDFEEDIDFKFIGIEAAQADVSERTTSLTEDDVLKLFNKWTDERGKFSLSGFIKEVFSSLAVDAAKFVIYGLFSTLTLIYYNGFNTEAIKTISLNISEDMASRDIRKVTTELQIYPLDQVAFLRKEAYLREGARGTAPILSGGKIKVNSVLTILERRGNWLKVEVNNGESSGEVGWIEESKVIKFKKK
ncbi:hypothetical protein V1499_22965 (plasmid) [Neobacillus sp. SCS-31]|uniref:hypothetical protein n=1 Tax=Neobacillus oceani TaxID=3115292 RepID=UPI0039058924